jgi:hypothetical protein
MIKYTKLSKSTRPDKYYMMIFYDKDKKKVKITHFGDPGGSQYYKHKNTTIRDNYIKRHQVNENFNDYTTPGALSRWILWNKTTIDSSYNDYLQKFNLKKL